MSRLETNSEEYRERIESRNLYTPENPYRLEEGNIIRAIDSIASVLSPFGNPDIGNSVLGRLASQNNTPIQQIGLAMLAKQFGHTVRSLGAAEYQPSVNFANLFDGDPNTKLFTKKIDFQITRRESQSNIGKIVEELTGNYRPINPFQNNPTNIDYFKQTGKGQQIFIVNTLNRSLYKPSSNSFQAAIDDAGLVYQSPTSISPKKYFSSLNSELYPYSRYYQFGLNTSSAEELNQQLNGEQNRFYSRTANKNKIYEYGSNDRYLDGLGRVKSIRSNENLDRLDQDFGLEDDLNNKIIWGRDGTNNKYKDIRDGFDKEPYINPDVEGGTLIPNSLSTNRFASDNTRPEIGLLAYTKELLNSRGKYGNFDLTKKKFVDKDELLSFNGMPFTENAQGEEDRRRQHSVVDPYDRYVKAIRFKGNEIYSGNENSTVYKSVMPKIAPSLKNGTVDIKNLMFSIENLAVSVDENGNIEDGDNAVKLPTSEIGDNGGRLMWFAPYDIKFSEQSIAKHESTVFLGRSEPIYTYNNSERLASLSFKLLIDYPPQLKQNPNLQTQSQASRFMAFGGEGKLPRPVDVNQKQKEIEELKKQLEELTVDKEIDVTTNIPVISKSDFFFPNDVPFVGGEAGAIPNTISNGYEDGVLVNNDPYQSDDGLNISFINKFDDVIDTAFSEENRGKYDIFITGYATKLYNSARTGIPADEYNLELSERRIQAAIEYINFKYSQIYGRTLDQDGIKIRTNAQGSAPAPESTDGSENISTLTSKSYRKVSIDFRPILNKLQPRGINDDLRINVQTNTDRLYLQTRISQLEREINEAKNNAGKGFESTFNQYTLEDGVFKGFKATQRKVNKFVPVFHSQTPEDFHRRLTFLQQCVRQGSAIRRENKSDNGNLFTAKNAVFGRQPIQILRLGDFYNTKVIIDNIQFEYGDAPWDLNPEGMGMQFMYADVTMQLKVIGGMSMRGPIDALQNAVSFNYYANSTFYKDGVYAKANAAENAQYGEKEDVDNDPKNDPLTNRNKSETNENNS